MTLALASNTAYSATAHTRDRSFCNDLCCYVTKSSPRFRCTLALNPAFSVAPSNLSPSYVGPSLWRTTIQTRPVVILFSARRYASAVLARPVSVRVPDRMSQAGVLAWMPPSAHPTLRCKENHVSTKIRVLPSGTMNLENFDGR